jgi:hypothetical protein
MAICGQATVVVGAIGFPAIRCRGPFCEEVAERGHLGTAVGSLKDFSKCAKGNRSALWRQQWVQEGEGS